MMRRRAIRVAFSCPAPVMKTYVATPLDRERNWVCWREFSPNGRAVPNAVHDARPM